MRYSLTFARYAGRRPVRADRSHPDPAQNHGPRVIVADTNLLVYLYVRGQRTAQAEAVLVRDPAWAAPLLWRSEFRNTLAGLVRAREIDFDDSVRISHDAERRMGGSESSLPTHRGP